MILTYRNIAWLRGQIHENVTRDSRIQVVLLVPGMNGWSESALLYEAEA